MSIFLHKEVGVMKRDRKLLWILTIGLVMLTLSCVTINIYFPAEKVESLAVEIVDDVRGNKGGDKEKPAKGDKSSRWNQIMTALAPSSACAEDATNVSNPTIRGLKDKMRSRFPQMKPYYQKGVIKEGSDGYVSVAGADSLGLKERQDLKSLVDGENRDRKDLYQEVAKALNIDPSQIGRVAEVFAKEWQQSVK